MTWFRFLPTTVGSGWIGAYVAVDQHLKPRDLADTDVICLSHDCENAEEFSAAVDDLIKELEELKVIAQQKFQRLEER